MCTERMIPDPRYLNGSRSLRGRFKNRGFGTAQYLADKQIEIALEADRPAMVESPTLRLTDWLPLWICWAFFGGVAAYAGYVAMRG